MVDPFKIPEDLLSIDVNDRRIHLLKGNVFIELPARQINRRFFYLGFILFFQISSRITNKIALQSIW